ncbi:MAG TPA: hypothetical protein VHQ39_08045 [Dongiaceae bacterium]|jgi:hypothetical protein|nr:hypothetical protein [Dongiaceae bacterium]
MSQHDYDIANASGATVRGDINSALAAIATLNAGAAAPSVTFANMLWADTTNTLLKKRNNANSAWVTIGALDSANLALMPLSGGSFTGAFNDNDVTLASASTVNIGAAGGRSINITGTTGITAFDTVQAGTIRKLRFAGALTWTHNSTSMILPGAANITTAAGDTAEVLSLGSGNWKCFDYTKADGTSVVGATGKAPITTKTADYTLVAADNGGTFIMNSASPHTFTLPDDATAGNGWTVRIINRGAGVCTIARAGTDTIASGGVTNLTSIALSQGDAGDVTADGVSHGIFWWRGARHYDSGQQTITAGGPLTLAHGLGVRPDPVSLILHCVTGELGYSAGDEVTMSAGQAEETSTNNRGVNTKVDATNLTIRYGNVAASIALNDGSTGSTGSITNANWKAIWRAWVFN